MTTTLPISVTIICKNEVDRIAETIHAVEGWVDEIIVVDSGSDDGTQEVVKETTARLYYNPWPGYGQQKRFAEDLSSNDWILNIDADERILPALRDELIAEFSAGIGNTAAYKIPIYDRFLVTRQLSKYKPYNPVRLYRKSVGRYRDSSVHDRVVLPENVKVKQLRNAIAHDSVKSFRHRIEKMNDYTDAQVTDMLAKGRQQTKIRLIGEFWVSFAKCYILRGYWRNGLIGYIYAMNFAYSRFLRGIKFLEVSRQEQNSREYR